MVVAAQVGTGLSKTQLISAALQQANATDKYVYFQLRDRPLFTPPALPDLKCAEIAKDMSVGMPIGLTVVGKVKGKGPKCRDDHPEKAEYELKRCSFDEANICLKKLYSAWAGCTLNIHAGAGGLHQGGYIATIMCDDCMNNKLSNGASTENELLGLIKDENVDCNADCRQTETYLLCEEVCDNADDEAHQECNDTLKICNDRAAKAFSSCKVACPTIDEACLEACQATADAASNSCISEENTCFGNCGGDTNCIVTCTLTRGVCETQATNEQVSCAKTCTDSTTTCLDKCTSEKESAEEDCIEESELCLAPLTQGAAECWSKCDEFLVACVESCDWGKDITKEAHNMFKNSPHPRDAAKKKAKGDRAKQDSGNNRAKEEEAQDLAKEIALKFGDGG